MVVVGFRPAYIPVIVGCACSRTFLPSPEAEDEARRIAGLPPIDRSTKISVGQESGMSQGTGTIITGGIIGAALLMFLFSGAF